MDLSFSDMLNIQREQLKAHPNWGTHEPKAAAYKLLWAYGEMGEVVDIVKKRGGMIADDPETRRHFIEEMADVYMYLADTLLCYGVTAEEISEIYHAKFERNNKRDFEREHKVMFDK